MTSSDDNERRKLTEIKYILAAGFACGIVGALIIMGLTGTLFYAARENLIAVLGGGLCLGVGGLFAGSFCGFAVKLALEMLDQAKPPKHVERDRDVTFWMPVIVSGMVSLVLGIVSAIAMLHILFR